MPRKFTEDTLVIASHNPGKVREIAELLAPYNIAVKSAGEFDLAEPAEDADSFLGNAKIKSDYVAQQTSLPALADDSGLVVPALDGNPGIYSARWAGEGKDFNVAMQKVEDALRKRGLEPSGQPAYFACALSITWPDGHVEQWQGEVHGTLTFPQRGERGFGYDPIFIADSRDVTFAEMEPQEKHAISHRADAFRQLVEACL